MSLSLRPYQRAAVDAVHAAALRGIRRPLVAAATGTGKTAMAAALVAERGGRAVLLAHRDELLRGLGRAVLMANPAARIGYVKAEEDACDADIVIASVATLARSNRLQRLLESQSSRRTLFDDSYNDRAFRTVIQDEGHHAIQDNTFGAVLDGLGAWRDDGPLTCAFTATPERGDGAALSTVWQEIVFEYSLLQGIGEGYLCNLVAKQVKLAADFSKLKVRAGEFTDSESAEVLMAADAPKHAAEAYIKYASGRPALCFTPTIAVAVAMADAFNAAGVPAEAAHGEMPIEERRAIVQRLMNGTTKVVSNAQLFTEGTDIPIVSCVIMAKPTKSRPAYQQMVGRATRLYPGKADAMILDLVGVADRHDLTTMATLFDVPPSDMERGLIAAVQKKQARERDEEGRPKAAVIDAADGRLVSVDVSLFRARTFAWIPAGDRFVLSLGQEGSLVLQPGLGADEWEILKRTREVSPGSKWPRDVERKTHMGLPLETAQSIAEDLVRKAGATFLNNKDAAWRKAPATDAQIKALKGRYRPGMSKGDCSDALSALFAQRGRR